MTRRLRDRARPWLGSAALHVAFVVVLIVAAYNWRSDPPPQQLAIEGDVVRYEDLPPSVRSGKPLREPQPTPPPEAPPEPAPTPPEPAPQPPPEPEAAKLTAEREAAEALKVEQARLAAEREAEQQRAAELEQARAAEARREQEAEALAARQRAAQEAEARRKAEEDKQREALAAKARQAEQEKAAREAKARAEREAALQRELASEEEREAFARSGVVDEYRTLLTQTIERNWNRPDSARAGLKCTLHVTQAPTGMVMDVRIGECNGDQAVRESITTAVYRSSPLPAPRDPRAFQRQLVMVFKPTE
ncbi:MAG TPA: cell envelope integrity protein TolA [Steroidobacteraceae bacterium]|nr:cell envelope integrity protein TolA [Steroidobacteraceae bacterium]